MGNKAEPFEVGDDCEICWGEGKPFGVGATPKRVYITGSGFAGACAPCNDTFVATQDLFAPCTWSFDNGLVSGGWSNGIVWANCDLFVAGVGQCFAGTGWTCDKEFTQDGKKVIIS